MKGWAEKEGERVRRILVWGCKGKRCGCEVMVVVGLRLMGLGGFRRGGGGGIGYGWGLVSLISFFFIVFDCATSTRKGRSYLVHAAS
jgi:hypothetical protein